MQKKYIYKNIKGVALENKIGQQKSMCVVILKIQLF